MPVGSSSGARTISESQDCPLGQSFVAHIVSFWAHAPNLKGAFLKLRFEKVSHKLFQKGFLHLGPLLSATLMQKKQSGLPGPISNAFPGIFLPGSSLLCNSFSQSFM